MEKKLTRAEKAALKAYPKEMISGESTLDGKYDGNATPRYYFITGYEQAERDTIERIIGYLDECDLEHTILDFDRDGYATIHFESLEMLIRKAMEEE